MIVSLNRARFKKKGELTNSTDNNSEEGGISYILNSCINIFDPTISALCY